MRVAGGCHLDREPLRLFEQAGLTLEGVRPWGRERWTLFPQVRGDAFKR